MAPPPPVGMGQQGVTGNGGGAGFGRTAAPQMPPPPTSAEMHRGALPSPSLGPGGPAAPRTYPVSNTVPTAYNGANLAGPPGSAPQASPRDQFGLSPNLSPPGSARVTMGPGGTGTNPYKAASSSSSASSRVDPSQMPRPPRPHVGAVYDTMSASRKVPPTVNTSMTVVDTGYASCRYLRTTLASPPCTTAMEGECALPFAFVATPFAPPEGCSKTEKPVPVVKSVDDNPVRCEGCRGYINPCVKWLENGASWECNLCRHVNVVPDYYYSSLDGTGQRMDRKSRAELSYGSVDFQVSGDYCIRPVQEPVYLFAVDISTQAVNSGAAFASLQSITSCVKRILADKDQRALHALTRIGIFTFNRMVQFYSVDLAAESEEGKVKMHVVDAWDPICAIPVSQWVKSINDEEEELLCLLERLPALIATEQGVDDNGYATASMSSENMRGSATGAAMKSACEALKGVGGKVMVLTPHGPSIGSPKYARQEHMDYYTGPYELKLYCDADTYAAQFAKDEKDKEERAAFVELAREASAHCLSYDVLLMDIGKEDKDTAVLADVCDATGGTLSLLRGSISEEDNVLRLERQVWHCLSSLQGTDAIAKIRASPGLKLARFLPGKGLPNYQQELELGCVDETTTFSGLLHIDGQVKDEEKVYLQLAVLYTNRYMRRMVRVHNIGMKATSSHSSVFRYCDLDVLMHTMGAQAAAKAMTTRLNKPAADGGPREFIRELTCDILHAYRAYCSPNSARGQLIMPDSLKMLPLYSMSLLKHPAFMDNVDLRGKCPYIRAMERAYEVRRLRSLPLRSFINSIYPRVFNLSDLDENIFEGGGSDDEEEEEEGDEDNENEAPLPSHWSIGAAGGGLASAAAVVSAADSAADTTAASTGLAAGRVLSNEQRSLVKAASKARARARGDAVRALVIAPRAPGVGSDALQSDSVYLLDEGSTLFLYVGRTVSSSELEEWFNVAPHVSPRPSRVSFSADSHGASLMRTMIEAVQGLAQTQPELVVVWADEPSSAESTKMALRLVEDSIYGVMSYTDYLCKLHATISGRMR